MTPYQGKLAAALGISELGKCAKNAKSANVRGWGGLAQFDENKRVTGLTFQCAGRCHPLSCVILSLRAQDDTRVETTPRTLVMANEVFRLRSGRHALGSVGPRTLFHPELAAGHQLSIIE